MDRSLPIFREHYVEQHHFIARRRRCQIENCPPPTVEAGSLLAIEYSVTCTDTSFEDGEKWWVFTPPRTEMTSSWVGCLIRGLANNIIAHEH
jgi:hypothetical protein